MRKLNPFQLPQVHTELETVPIASTSQMSPFGECSGLDKSLMLAADESTDEFQSRVEIVPQCSSNPDLFNILLTEQQQNINLSRPRQYGRRSDPVRISSCAVESCNNGTAVRWKKNVI